MRLHDFIRQNMEQILVQWERFASTLLPAATSMTRSLLRDHAHEILEAVMKDISAPQTDKEQDNKSKGLIEKLPGAPETAAETHGLLRAKSGFEIKQMASEYRALRASVLKLWLIACGNSPPHLEDLIRFNEAMDQALAESIDFFTEQVDARRNMFIGMLGHDMRTSLQSIQMTALVLKGISTEKKVSSAAKRLIESGTRLAALLDELIEFNEIKVELPIRIAPAPQDMALLIKAELDELRSAYPDRQLDLSVSGPTQGEWDGGGLKRAVGNLVVNAMKHGNTTPIKVVVRGHADRISLEIRDQVHGQSPGLNDSNLDSLFEPPSQGSPASDQAGDSQGLGLFIAQQIVKAHGGNLQAHSIDADRLFVINLPMVSLPPTRAALARHAHAA